MLCVPVFIFTSGSSALIGRPRCGLSIWLSLLAIFTTLFWVYANFCHEKTDKTRKYSKSAIYVGYKNGRRRLLGAQSINTDRAAVAPVSGEIGTKKNQHYMGGGGRWESGGTGVWVNNFVQDRRPHQCRCKLCENAKMYRDRLYTKFPWDITIHIQ